MPAPTPHPLDLGAPGRHQIVPTHREMRAKHGADERSLQIVEALLAEWLAAQLFLQQEPRNGDRRV